MNMVHETVPKENLTLFFIHPQQDRDLEIIHNALVNQLKGHFSYCTSTYDEAIPGFNSCPRSCFLFLNPPPTKLKAVIDLKHHHPTEVHIIGRSDACDLNLEQLEPLHQAIDVKVDGNAKPGPGFERLTQKLVELLEEMAQECPEPREPLPTLELEAKKDSLLAAAGKNLDLGLTHFKDHGGEEDLSALKEARQAFHTWKNNIMRFVNDFDDLLFDFLEAVERRQPFELKHQRLVIHIPFSPKEPQAYQYLSQDFPAALTQFQQNAEEATPKKLSELFLEIPQVNVRHGHDTDFQPMQEPDEPKSRIFLKDMINNVLLFYKILSKTYPKIVKCLTWLQKQDHVSIQPKGFEFQSMLQCLLENQEDLFNGQLENTNALLRHNYDLLSQCRDGVRNARKHYIRLLEHSLFRVYNELHHSLCHFQQTWKDNFSQTPDSKSLIAWMGIYSELIDLLHQHLTQLGIQTIYAERGESYDPDRHRPHMEAEEDPELENEQIKETVNHGFICNQDVLKMADVIVVRNPSLEAIETDGAL